MQVERTARKIVERATAEIDLSRRRLSDDSRVVQNPLKRKGARTRNAHRARRRQACSCGVDRSTAPADIPAECPATSECSACNLKASRVVERGGTPGTDTERSGTQAYRSRAGNGVRSAPRLRSASVIQYGPRRDRVRPTGTRAAACQIYRSGLHLD